MSNSPPIVSTVQLGVAGGSTPISASLDGSTQQFDQVYVTLSASYVQSDPPGFLVGTPGMQGGAPNSNRGSYSNGQRALFWRCEAAALVTAGVAAYS
jgi:hypothetical protein